MRRMTYYYKILVNGCWRLRDRSTKLSRNLHLTPPLPMTRCLSIEKECIQPKYKNRPCLQKTEKFPTLPKPYNTKQYTFYVTDVLLQNYFNIPYIQSFYCSIFRFHAVRLRSESL